MNTTAAVLLLVATLGAGIAAGLLYLQRSRKAWLVTTHLVLALAGTALVAQQVIATRPTGVSLAGAWPLLILVVAVVVGWSARRVARTGSRGSTLMLAGHAVAGVAGFLVFLAWARGVAGGVGH